MGSSCRIASSPGEPPLQRADSQLTPTDTPHRAMPGARRVATMHGMRSDPRFEALQAAVVALAVALRPEQAAVARGVLLAGVADLKDREGSGADDAAAAGILAAVLAALGHAVAPPLANRT